jgi:glycine/D-amino acid oxidase-like deaminating enzyme
MTPATQPPETLSRDLRTGRTAWQASRMPKAPTHRPASGRFDVVVVGAGISGALVAEAMTDAGMSTLVVDRRGVAKGSTAASTALLQHELDVPLTRLASRIGVANAARAWQRSRLAVAALTERTRALGIDAGMERRDSLYLQGNAMNAGQLEAEAAERRRIGLNAEFLDRGEVAARFGIERRAAILSTGNSVADPRKLTAGYLRVAVSRGARIYTPINVTDVHAASSGVSVSTEQGYTFRARHLVYATGYELPTVVPTRGHRVVSTWAIATRAQPRRLWPEECLIWEAAEPYLYMRTTSDGRVICGGEDEPFSDSQERDERTPAKAARLAGKLSKMFPDLDTTPQFAWAGAFGASSNGMPTIGPVPRMPNCYAVLGFGGNGITFSMLAAQLIRSAITGARDVDAPLFAFRR